VPLLPASTIPRSPQGNKDMRTGLPPIHSRPASAREARQYLLQPSFSNCTVPVVFYQHNGFNFAHGGPACPA